ncbi:MAG TPA: serine/threonine-protein kinase, partial [Polyangiaceae bacterium]
THGAGVVHRDLKPDNIMLATAGDRADHVKVLDFGIALFTDVPGADRLTATQGVQGTPAYMSPEQCRGRDVGPPADVYSVGAVLYEMLAGEAPFDAPSAVELMARHLYVAAVPVGERGVGRAVPQELEQLALRALSKQPAERPTAAEMLDELDRYSRGTSEVAIAQRAAEERIRAVGLSRSQRGLPSPPGAPELVAEEQASVAYAWGIPAERLEGLQAALSVQQLSLRRWAELGPPPPTTPEGTVVKAVVVLGDAGITERLRALRARPEGGAIPVLAVDARPESTALLVKAGASDVALAMVGDDVLCAKLVRLVRRGR